MWYYYDRTVYTNNGIHNELSLLWGTRIWIAKVSHAGVTSVHDWTPIKSLNAKAQVNSPGWQLFVRVVTYSCQEQNFISRGHRKPVPSSLQTSPHAPFLFSDFSLYSSAVLNYNHNFNSVLSPSSESLSPTLVLRNSLTSFSVQWSKSLLQFWKCCYSTLSRYLRKCHDTFHQLFLLTQLLILFHFKPPKMTVSKDGAVEVKDTAEYWT